LKNGIQVKGEKGMDPGFHRGDDKVWILASAGMTETEKADFESTPTKSLGFEPRVV
jgi:hypothetical protein